MDKKSYQPTGMRFTMEDHAKLFTPVNRPDAPSMNPGAWRAKQLGCICSRLDNQNGYGSVYQTDFSEGIEFLVIPNCPLHDKREEDVQANNND